eukprot:5128161-Pleurochrysis_carterae.AAC.2
MLTLMLILMLYSADADALPPRAQPPPSRGARAPILACLRACKLWPDGGPLPEVSAEQPRALVGRDERADRERRQRWQMRQQQAAAAQGRNLCKGQRDRRSKCSLSICLPVCLP